MDNNSHLDASLAALGASATAAAPDGFLDGVWQRAGQLQERADGRRRLALFCGLFVVGLGAGFGTIHTPTAANSAPYQLDSIDDLSPSALLHVEP
jgi:hypothetical protein